MLFHKVKIRQTIGYSYNHHGLQLRDVMSWPYRPMSACKKSGLGKPKVAALTTAGFSNPNDNPDRDFFTWGVGVSKVMAHGVQMFVDY